VRDVEGKTALEVARLRVALAPKGFDKANAKTSLHQRRNSGYGGGSGGGGDDDVDEDEGENGTNIVAELEQQFAPFLETTPTPLFSATGFSGNQGSAGSGGGGGGSEMDAMVRWQTVFNALRDGPREESDQKERAHSRAATRPETATAATATTHDGEGLSPLALVRRFLEQGCVDSEGCGLAHQSQGFLGAGHTLATLAAEKRRPRCVHLLREAERREREQRQRQHNPGHPDSSFCHNQLPAHTQERRNSPSNGLQQQQQQQQQAPKLDVAFHKGMRQLHFSVPKGGAVGNGPSSPVREKWVQTQMTRSGRVSSIALSSSFQLG